MKTEKQRLIERRAYHVRKIANIDRRLENIRTIEPELVTPEMLDRMPFDQPYTTRELRALSYGWRKFIERTSDEVKAVACDKFNIQIEPYITINNVKGTRFIRRQF